LLDDIGDRACDLGALRPQPRQRLGCEIEHDYALAALLHQIAADRLAHHTDADEAGAFVI
jgi:hypothetical protein